MFVLNVPCALALTALPAPFLPPVLFNSIIADPAAHCITLITCPTYTLLILCYFIWLS